MADQESQDHVIRFSAEDRARVEDFAKNVAAHTYNRRGVSRAEQERDVRIGKLGEVAFAIFLQRHGKRINGEDMFTVWEGTMNVDKLDFRTKDGKTIDVKTASRPNHTRILVPKDQLEQQPKDYYVAVRISPEERVGTVIGYATHQDFLRAGLFGGAIYYPAYAVSLGSMRNMDSLLPSIADR